MKSRLTLLILLACFSFSAVAQNTSVNKNGEARNAQGTPTPLSINTDKPIKVTVSSDNVQSGLNPWWKDMIDAASKIAGVIGIVFTFVSIIIAGVLGYNQVTRNREIRQNELEERKERLEQRKDELNWKKEEARRKDAEVRREKANLARTVLSDMADDTYASDAMSMLDWGERDYDVKTTPGAPAMVELITERDMWAALRINELHFIPKERYIRDCFDHFLQVMEVLEHYIQIDLVDAADVGDPFAYFAKLMKEDGRWLYEYFIDEYHEKAGSFLKRFPEWTRCLSCNGTNSKACKTCQGTGDYTIPNLDKAFFMFDCPPGKDRFILMLEDKEKIKIARERVLSRSEDLHVRGEIIPTTVAYNEPWSFHLDPATIDFVETDPEFADKINTCVESQLSRAKATFPPNDVWHTGGARLLAEVPIDRFEGEQVWADGTERLTQQGRISRAPNL